MNYSNYSRAILFLLLTLFSTGLHAQLFEVGDKDLNMTIGLRSTLHRTSDAYTSSLNPLLLSFDYGLRNDWGPGVFSLGGCIGVSTYKYEDQTNSGWKYTTLLITARSTYHYQLIDKLDTYGGIMPGIQYTSERKFGTNTTVDDTAYKKIAPILPFFIGAKYYITPKFSVLAELGWGTAMLNIGAGVKW